MVQFEKRFAPISERAVDRLIVCELLALVSRRKRKIGLYFFDGDFELLQRVNEIVHHFLLLGGFVMIFVEISKVESGDGRVLTFVSFGGDNDRFRLLCGFRAQVGSANVLLLKLVSESDEFDIGRGEASVVAGLLCKGAHSRNALCRWFTKIDGIGQHLKPLLGGLVFDLIDDVLRAINIGRHIFDGGVGDESARIYDHVMGRHGGGGGGCERGSHVGQTGWKMVTKMSHTPQSEDRK